MENTKAKRSRSKLSVDDYLKARDEAAAALAAELPSEIDGLMAAAKQAVFDCDTAVLSGEMLKASLASKLYDAVIWKLNGGTFLGSHDCSNLAASAGGLVERHCRARAGVVPRWGELGEFLITVQGVRCLVVVKYGWGDLTKSCIEFHAVDLDRPFVSETGYLADFIEAAPGHTVDNVAAEAFAAFLSGRRRYLSSEIQEQLARDPLPSWMEKLSEPPMRIPNDPKLDRLAEHVPKGHVYVDVVLPSHQAFIVRRWAKAARSKLAALKAAEKAALRDPYSKEKTFREGQRCVIEWEPRDAFKKNLGKVVVVAKVNEETDSVWVHDDRPVTFKKNRKGRRVVDFDPRCIQTVYSMEALRPLN